MAIVVFYTLLIGNNLNKIKPVINDKEHLENEKDRNDIIGASNLLNINLKRQNSHGRIKVFNDSSRSIPKCNKVVEDILKNMENSSINWSEYMEERMGLVLSHKNQTFPNKK